MNHTLATQTPRKKPQDHKPKDDSLVYFDINGTSHPLPRINQDMVNKIPGRIVEGALLDGEEGQAAMAFALLRAVPGHDETKEALRDLPFAEMIGKLLDWLNAGGAPLGESQG